MNRIEICKYRSKSVSKADLIRIYSQYLETFNLVRWASIELHDAWHSIKSQFMLLLLIFEELSVSSEFNTPSAKPSTFSILYS